MEQIFDAYMDMEGHILPAVKKITAQTIQSLYKNPKRWTKSAWATFRGHKNTVCFCLDGAAQAIYLKKMSKRATTKYLSVLGRLADAIRTLHPDDYSLIHSVPRSVVVSWNDQVGRTLDEVRAVVKLAKV